MGTNPYLTNTDTLAFAIASRRALMMGVIEVGRSENASMVSKTATSRLAMVFPPAETEVPDPVNTTTFSIRSHSEINA